MKHDKSLLTLCLDLVEKKLGWGDSQHWTNSDFETLSEKILAETGVSLSPSTLKRLWGRVKYTSTPQRATLNTLARFVGYPNYRDFQIAYKEVKKSEPAEVKGMPIPEKALGKSASRKRLLSSSGIWSIGLVTGFILSLLLAFSLSRQQSEDKVADPIQYSFSSQPVSTGIPNSVVFTFDVSQAKTDCLQIQQSWDENLRFSIKKDQHLATSIYYYPGFYKAKLLVDSLVVKEHDLYIKTKGWLPLVEQQPIPVYFTPEEGIRDGSLGLTADQLRNRSIPLQPVVPWVCYYYVQEMDGLSSHNFMLETSLKNTFSIGSGACQNSSLVVLCENSAITIPLSIPGCTSAINAFIAGELLRGDQTDLSALGVDFSDWVNLRLTVKNKNAQVFVNGKPVLQSTFSQNAGKIIGIVFRFQGTGSVDYLHLYNRAGNMTFQEEF